MKKSSTDMVESYRKDLAGKCINKVRICFSTFFRSDVFDSLFLIADDKCFRYRTKQPMNPFPVILAGAKCPYRNVDDIGGCALQASTYEGDWQNDLQDLQILGIYLEKLTTQSSDHNIPVSFALVLSLAVWQGYRVPSR